MTPFQNQERIKAQILASYNNAPAPIVKAEAVKKEEEIGKTEGQEGNKDVEAE